MPEASDLSTRKSNHFCQIIQSKTGLDGIDTDSIFLHPGRARLLKEMADVASGFWLLARRYGVLEIKGYTIDVEPRQFSTIFCDDPGTLL